MFGAAQLPKAVEMKATKASIERMARALKEEQGGTIKSRVDSVLDAVRASGGVVVKESRSVKPHKPEPRQIAAGETS